VTQVVCIKDGQLLFR